MKEFERYFDRLVKMNSQSNVGVFAGVFTVKSLLEEHFMIMELDDNHEKPILKITLAAN